MPNPKNLRRKKKYFVNAVNSSITFAQKRAKVSMSAIITNNLKKLDKWFSTFFLVCGKLCMKRIFKPHITLGKFEKYLHFKKLHIKHVKKCSVPIFESKAQK